MEDESLGLEDASHLQPPVEESTVISPSDDNEIGDSCRVEDCLVVQIPDGISDRTQRPRIGRTHSEDICGDQSAEPPCLRESDAPAIRRVKGERVGRRRIQHEEVDDRPIGIPRSSEGVAEHPIG